MTAGPVTDYVHDAQPIHRALQRALVQLSAYTLIQFAARRAALVDRSPVELARAALADCAEALAGLRVPAAAAHHRHHLGAAADALELAARTALARSRSDGDAIFHALEAAERHLKAVGRLIPGFEPVDLAQACCAAHAGPAGAPVDYPRTRRTGEDNGRLFNMGARLRCG